MSETEKPVQTIREIFRLKPPAVFTSSKATPVDVACPTLLQGLELEIEGCGDYQQDWCPSGMSATEDGSLRDHGKEFITAPATLSVTASILRNFFSRRNFGERNYSDRCSVHVHNNCQDLTPEQLASVLLLYQMVEEPFFSFIGNDRRDNIYCVPWCQSNLNYNIIRRMVDGYSIPDWQKYTAVNLRRLSDLGTIEFRHMAGTNDVDRILIWCNLIGCLFEYAKSNDHDKIVEWVLSLNTSSEYKKLLDTVFTKWADHLKVPGYERLISEGVLAAKYMLTTPKRAEKKLSPQKEKDVAFTWDLRAEGETVVVNANASLTINDLMSQMATANPVQNLQNVPRAIDSSATAQRIIDDGRARRALRALVDRERQRNQAAPAQEGQLPF